MKIKVIILAIAIILLGAYVSAYTVDETEQVLVTQFGRPVQSIAQLGQPLSGGCVRQAVDDAVWMWNWAQIGTKVVVLP